MKKIKIVMSNDREYVYEYDDEREFEIEEAINVFCDEFRKPKQKLMILNDGLIINPMHISSFEKF